MKTKILVPVLAVAALILILLLIPRPGTQEQSLIPASISGLAVEKPNFVVSGNNLGKVEIWAIPTGTGITENNYQLIGIAIPDGADNWVLPIPSEPLLVTNIFAKGYDANGNVVGTVELQETGATSLYDALWGNVSSKSGDLTLGVGKSGTVGRLTITFNKLVQDSRCPIDVQCIQAGAVNTNVTFKTGAETKTFNMPSDEVPQRFDGYGISITNIDPPRHSGEEILPNDYRITFHVDAIPVVGAGERCGGNMLNAPVCGPGLTCVPEPGSHLPFGDVGGICIAATTNLF